MHKKVYVNSKNISGKKVGGLIMWVLLGILSVVFIVPALIKLGKKLITKLKKKNLSKVPAGATTLLPDPTTT